MANSNSFQDIHPGAKIGENVQIGSFVTIQQDVEIGDNTWIGPNVVIMSGTRIGENCKIFPGAILGAIPQDLKYKGEECFLIIGNNVTVREYCTLNKGTVNQAYNADGKTIIHDNCLLMAYVHVAHDCIIENNCILANNASLAGHITIGQYATIGGLSAVHQFVRIGQHAMIGGGSLVRKDVPPYITAAREPLSYINVNSIGLLRRGFSRDQVHEIEEIYKILFVHEQNKARALKTIEGTLPETAFREEILAFVNDGKRGIIRGYRSLRDAGKLEDITRLIPE